MPKLLVLAVFIFNRHNKGFLLENVPVTGLRIDEKVPHMDLVLRQVKVPDVLVTWHQDFNDAVGCCAVAGGHE